jgi:hypothetical protein
MDVGAQRHRRMVRFGAVLCVITVAAVSIGGCGSNDSKSGAGTTVTPYVRWRQCLARHGARVPTTRAARPRFTRAQLAAAVRKSPTLRKKLVVAVLKPPKGANAVVYRRAVTACAPKARK